MRHYQDYQEQGFSPVNKTQSNQAALREAKFSVTKAIAATPTEQRELYKSVIRWEGGGYGWYWILR